MARTIELILRIITEPARKELEKLRERIEKLQKLEMLPADEQKQAVSAVVRQFDKFQKSIEKSEQKAEKLQKALEEAGKADPFEKVRKSLEGVESAAEQAAEAVGTIEKSGKKAKTSFERLLKAQAIFATAEHFAQWGQQITAGSVALETATARIRTLGGEARKLAPDLEKMALQLAGSLPLSASEIANAMYNALSAGIEPSKEAIEAFITTAGKLATGGMEDMGRAVDVLSGVLNAYGASAQEAARYSDILFQTVNLGKTTIPELSSSLSQVVPTAAAAGVELEQVGAALAEMTARGIPTSMAATRLNQLLVEMQKPGGELAKVLQRAGISLETLRNEELPTVLGRIQEALKKTGKTATQVFGSSEAAAAFNALTVNLGSFEQKLQDIANASGVTEEAFSTMADTTENRVKAMQASLDAFFASMLRGLGPMGAGFQLVTRQLAAIAPHVSSLLAIKELIPSGAFRAAIAGFKNLRLSALSFNTVMQLLKAHPIMAIAAALTAATTGAVALYDALTTTNEELLEQNKQQQEAIKTQRKIIEQEANRQQTAAELARQYQQIAEELQKGGLSAEQAAQKQEQLQKIGEKLNEIYPGTIKSTASLAENLRRVGEVSAEASTKLSDYQKQLSELDEQSRKLARQQIKIEAQIAAEAVTKDIGGIFDTLGETAEYELEQSLNRLSQQVLQATSVEQVQKLGNKMREALFAAFEQKTIDAGQYNAAIAGINKLIQKQLQYLEFGKKKQQESTKAAEDAKKAQDKITQAAKQTAEQRKRELEAIERAREQLVRFEQKIVIQQWQINIAIIKQQIEELKKQIVVADPLQIPKLQAKIDELIDRYKDAKITLQVEVETQRAEEELQRYEAMLKAAVEKGVITQKEAERRLAEYRAIINLKSSQKRVEIEKKTTEETKKMQKEVAEVVRERTRERIRERIRERTQEMQGLADAWRKEEEERKKKEDKEKQFQALLMELQQQRVDALKDALEQAQSLFREHTIAFKALALAQAIISTYEGATKAIAKTEIFPFNFVLAGMIIAKGMAMVAKIAGVTFRRGGYTGDGAPDEPAGVVHKGEFVLRREAVEQNRAWLEELNQRGGVSLEKMVEERSRFVMRREVQRIVREAVQQPVQVVVQPAAVDLEPLRQELSGLRREMRRQKETLQRVQLHVDVSDQELIRRVEQRRIDGIKWA